MRNRELKQARFDLANEAERERGRIARDLHDQTLADLRNLMLRSDKLGITDATFREDIEFVSKEVRRICEDLSPSVLENVGLTAALEFLLSHSVENYRFESSEASDEDVTFPTSVQLQIYRIAQEALSNIQKHSDATTVEMRVKTPSAGSFRLTIVDNGSPFAPAADTKLDGRGIGGIRSRASLINAEVIWGTRGSDGNEFRLSLDIAMNPSSFRNEP
jgi:signal transduction histidine kinase